MENTKENRDVVRALLYKYTGREFTRNGYASEEAVGHVYSSEEAKDLISKLLLMGADTHRDYDGTIDLIGIFSTTIVSICSVDITDRAAADGKDVAVWQLYEESQYPLGTRNIDTDYEPGDWENRE